MMKNALGSYWQGLAGISAVATGSLGIRQFITDEVSAGITTGKVVGLVVLAGAGVLTLAGLATYRSNPRLGAILVMVGLLPVAAVGGFGIGLAVGLVMTLTGALGWWWVPVGVASLVATAAGLGAFSAWWHASPKVAASSPRSVLVPLALVVVGLLAAATGVGLGWLTSPLVAFGAVLAVIGVGLWTRHLKTVR
jgi:hypothetical protein